MNIRRSRKARIWRRLQWRVDKWDRRNSSFVLVWRVRHMHTTRQMILKRFSRSNVPGSRFEEDFVRKIDKKKQKKTKLTFSFELNAILLRTVRLYRDFKYLTVSRRIDVHLLFFWSVKSIVTNTSGWHIRIFDTSSLDDERFKQVRAQSSTRQIIFKTSNYDDSNPRGIEINILYNMTPSKPKTKSFDK